MSATYTATAIREGRWWVLEVDGVGATQVRSLRDAADEVRNMVAITRDVDPDTFEVDIFPQVDAEAQTELEEARRAADDARTAQNLAAGKIRHAAARLERSGLTRVDVAVVLGVSPQRVSQLLADLDPSETGAAKARARRGSGSGAIAS